MIVMQVRDEEVRHPRLLNPKFEQPMMSAETMIQEDNVVADLHDVDGTHSPQRGRRCPRSKQPNFHTVPLASVGGVPFHGNTLCSSSSGLFPGAGVFPWLRQRRFPFEILARFRDSVF